MRRRALAALIGAAILTLAPAREGLTNSTSSNTDLTMTATMSKLTPVLLVERIEPALPFWVDRLGFKKTLEVPHGDALGFIILEKDNVEIMYQSRASLEGDIPALGRNATGGSILFIEVSDIGEVERAMRGAEVTFSRRTAPYGMEEIGVREPGGNAVIFAQPVPQGR
jgi:hypothetical protein